MGGIDLKDQLLQMYLIERKRLYKWYMKLFRRLLNATVLNALIIYRHTTRKQIDQLAFRVNLLEVLFQQFVEIECKYQVAGWKKISFHNCMKDISSKTFLLLGKNQHRRGGMWYAPNTDGGKT
jgi:hypothetical protein